MSKGQFYASTGVTITGVVVEGDQITVETADAERLWASIDRGEVISRAQGTSITFRVPPRATYARVTCSRGEGVHHIEGEQFAWTQPFWVSVGGVPRSTDPRHMPTGGGWQRLRKIGIKGLAREIYRAEAEANVRGRRPSASELELPTSRERTTSRVKAYYDSQLPTYLEIWGDDGRISFGFFDPPSVETLSASIFKEAQHRQMERLAELGTFDENSIILDLGCGAALNCFYLVRRFGCRVVGLDNSHAMIRKARSNLATNYSECYDRLAFFEGTIEDLVADLSQLSKRGADGEGARAEDAAEGGDAESGILEQGLHSIRRLLGHDVKLDAPFTHLWSTCTLWFIPEAKRCDIFTNFAAISTPTSRLVIDDCLCPNRVISRRSQLCLYDRLNLSDLWSPSEYRKRAEAGGFSIEVEEDISSHCELTYAWLGKSARKAGHEKLAADYDGTIDAVRQGDLAWYIFIATRSRHQS